jgi:copper(I)-binding protein
MNTFRSALLALLLAPLGSVLAAGHLMVEDPWVREGPPTAPALGAFMVLMNHSDQAMDLVGASSDVCDRVEIHRTVMDGKMARMIKQDKITIPANGKAVLKPGDYHIMLIRPHKAYKAGEKIDITLIMADGSKIPVSAEVRKAMGGMMMHNHGMHQH